MEYGIEEKLSQHQVRRYSSMQPVDEWLAKREIPNPSIVVTAVENILELDPVRKNKYVRIEGECRTRVYRDHFISRAWDGVRSACKVDTAMRKYPIGRAALQSCCEYKDYRSTLPDYVELKNIDDENTIRRMAIAANDAVEKLDECGDYGARIEFDLMRGSCWEYRLYPTYLLDLAFSAVAV